MNCLDTSILIEIAYANPKFLPYAQQRFIITDLTLAEFCRVMLKKYDEQTMDYWFKKLEPLSQPAPLSLLYEAVKFRHRLKHPKISFNDVVAYVFAKHYNCTLITTDNDFQNLPGVDILGK